MPGWRRFTLPFASAISIGVTNLEIQDSPQQFRPVGGLARGAASGNGKVVVVSSTGGVFTRNIGDYGNFVEVTAPFSVSGTTSVPRIAFGGGYFVIVSNNTVSPSQNIAQICRSADGVNWELVTNIQTVNNSYSKIAYGNGVFCFGSQGFLHYSSDALTWTTVGVSGEGSNAQSVFYSNGYFYRSSASSFTRSSDLSSWENVNITAGTIVRAIAFDGTKYLFCSTTGTTFHSTDGVNLTSSTAVSIADVVWFNDRFVASMSATLSTSVDGSTWTNTYSSPFDSANICDCFFMDGATLSILSYTKTASVFRTTDALSWLEEPVHPVGISGVSHFAKKGDTILATGSQARFVSYNGGQDFYNPIFNKGLISGSSSSSAFADDNVFLMGRNIGTIAETEDGVIISAVRNVTGTGTGGIVSICKIGSTYLCCSTLHGLYSSTDRVSWINRLAANSSEQQRVFVLNGLVIVTSLSYVKTSTDDFVFVDRTFPGFTSLITNAYYYNNRYFFAGGTDRKIYSTLDFITWDVTALVTPRSATPTNFVEFMGQLYVSASTSVFRTSDGVTWIECVDNRFKQSVGANSFLFVHNSQLRIITNRGTSTMWLIGSSDAYTYGNVLFGEKDVCVCIVSYTSDQAGVTVTVNDMITVADQNQFITTSGSTNGNCNYHVSYATGTPSGMVLPDAVRFTGYTSFAMFNADAYRYIP